jgi:hypothetical protein
MGKDRVKAIISALEHFWLRYEAAMHLLEEAQVPNYWEIVENYAEQPENKHRAHDRFLEATVLLQSSLRDSTELEKLLEVLQRSAPKSKPN